MFLSTAKSDGELPTRSKTRETARSRSRALFGLKADTGPNDRDRGCASQFDPVIDKERKLIGNLKVHLAL